MDKIIGIDLGTTNSVMAIIKDGKPVIIPNCEGERTTPSIVYITPKGTHIVGKGAKKMVLKEPQKTVLSIKRKMGSNYKINIHNKDYTPEEISAFILSKLKSDAENYLGEKIKRAVITVPAYFNNLQRQATKKAGIMAGLEVIRIINEPTAASLAYGLDKEDIHTVLVWDLGGGTFDVSILELGEGFFEVKAVNGDTRLGGDDWDEKIIKYILDESEEDKTLLQRVRYIAEKIKIKLSSQMEATINIPFLHLVKVLTGEKFKEIAEELLQKMINCTKHALSDASLNTEEIDRVILVGGATRMPMVRELARKFFNKEPYTDINPEEAVALGAAIQVGIIEKEINDVTLVDVTPLSLGIEAQGGVFAKIIERNTSIPTSASKIFTTACDSQTRVDINVFQGEKDMTFDNMNLGMFILDDIPSLPKGIPKIEVIFSIDKNGILEVKAKELETELEEKIEVKTLMQVV